MKQSHALFPLFSLVIIIASVVLVNQLPSQSFEGQGALQLQNGIYTYSNTDLGVAFDFPKIVSMNYGACSWDLSEHSYRPAMGAFPLTVIEDPASRSVYLTPAYFYDLAESVPHGKEGEGFSYTFRACNKIQNSLTLVASTIPETVKWKITMEPVENQQEVETTLKRLSGKGCSIGSLDPLSQSGSFLIHIAGDGKSLGDTECQPQNFFLYKPSANKLLIVTPASGIGGGGCSLQSATAENGCAETSINESIRFF